MQKGDLNSLSPNTAFRRAISALAYLIRALFAFLYWFPHAPSLGEAIMELLILNMQCDGETASCLESGSELAQYRVLSDENIIKLTQKDLSEKLTEFTLLGRKIANIKSSKTIFQKNGQHFPEKFKLTQKDLLEKLTEFTLLGRKIANIKSSKTIFQKNGQHFPLRWRKYHK